MTRVTTLVTLAALLTAASLPALAARCPHECRHLLKGDLSTCRAVCPKHRPGRACRSACFVEFKAQKVTCKAATNPTPPECGAMGYNSCCNSPAPTCGGTCPDGEVCGVGTSDGFCVCVPSDNTCQISQAPT